MQSGEASQLIEKFIDLQKSCEILSDAILNLGSMSPNWDIFLRGLNDQNWRNHFIPSQATAHQIVATQFKSLTHGHQGDGRDTWKIAGLIAAPKEILAMVKIVNQDKESFSNRLKIYQQLFCRPSPNPSSNALSSPLQKVPSVIQIFEDQQKTNTELRTLMNRIGASRIHLRHCTRKIFYLEQTPKSISLSWIKQRRSITKITAQQCETALMKLAKNNESGSIDAQLKRLQQLKSQDFIRLRKVQLVNHPSVKAKVFWEDGSSEDLGFLSMPAIIPVDSTIRSLPQYTQLSQSPPESKRKKRSDSKLEETPFLPAIRVFLTQAQLNQDQISEENTE